MPNPFWRWVRLREGRTIYRAVVLLDHADGTPVTLTVEGKHPEYVACLANALRTRYSPAAGNPRVTARADFWSSLFSYLQRKKS